MLVITILIFSFWSCRRPEKTRKATTPRVKNTLNYFILE